MNHEYLNGDAMKEIIQDDSIDLFIMWPPYLGVDTLRYASPNSQLNKINDVIIFAKRLTKIIKNCAKALRQNGNIALILPTNDPELAGYVYRYIKKKTKLQYNGTLIWNYSAPHNSGNTNISADYCDILWFSKGSPKVDESYIAVDSSGIINIPLQSEYLAKDYGKLGHVYDAMPEELAEKLIKWFSRPGDTVANVMGGTGTVSIAAENTGRDSVYNDVSFVQLTIAKKRMEDLITSKKKKPKQLKSAEDDSED